MKKVLLFLFLAGFSHTASATEVPRTSLFFSPQEKAEAERLAQTELPAGQGDIRLGAVMYYGPMDWTLWLQGEKWTPQTTRDDLRIVEVTPEHVRFVWQDADNATERDITLKPNESYQISTGNIIEGF